MNKELEAEISKRIEKTKSLMDAEKIKGLIAFSSYPEKEGNVQYLTNHRNYFPQTANNDIILGLGYAAIVIEADNPPILIAPLGYQKENVVSLNYSKTSPNLVNDLIEVIKDQNLSKEKIGIVGSDIIPYSFLKKIINYFSEADFLNVDSIIQDQRKIKSDMEVKTLEEAGIKAEKCILSTLNYISTGQKECEIAAHLYNLGLEEEIEFIARTRVHSGPMAATLRWPLFSNRSLKNNELISIDFIGWFKKYAFDILATKFIGNGENPNLKLVELSRMITKKSCEAIGPGVYFSELFKLIKKLEMETGLKINFFGHGIGIEVVENPILYVDLKNDFKFLPGMVLCIEPTIVDREGSKACFEEEIVVTEDGFKRITNLT